MTEELNGAFVRPTPAGAVPAVGDARHHPWTDSSSLSVLQLMVESVTEMIGFEVAVLSVAFGSDLVTMAYAGPDEFREQAYTTDPAWVLDPVLEQAQTWGRFRFLAAEDIVGEFAGTWIETVTTQQEGVDAWHPKDVLIGVLTDETGGMCGTLSVDMPLSGRRPDAAQRRLLERYAAQAERAVATAFERERLVQQVTHAEDARRLIRAASMSAQASLEAVLQRTHGPLVEAFSASGTWIQVLGLDSALRGYARSHDGQPVQLSDTVVDLARRMAPLLWDEQRVLLLGHGAGTGAGSNGGDDSGAIDGLLVADAVVQLERLGLTTVLGVPLGVGAECLGFLALTRRAQDPPWSNVEMASALEIGHDLGAALMTARALERERDLVAELQKLDEYRIRLIETLSHEMRTPLAVISGNLEMLEDVDLDAGAAQFRAAINRGTARMQRVVDDLLLLAAISHPQHPLVLARVGIEDAIGDIIEFFSSHAQAKGVTLQVRVDEPGLELSGQASEIDRLLSNLVSNAIKYTPQGGTISISACRRDETVVLEVADDGLGISPSDQVGLFTAFFRTTNPDALREPGTGLGLAIVERIAHRHGGSISVRSQLGAGTTFAVTLPLAPSGAARSNVAPTRVAGWISA